MKLNKDTIKLRNEMVNQDLFGGYEPVAYTDDGGVLCLACVEKEKECIESAYPGDGWHIIAIENNIMIDGSLRCDHCNKELCPYIDESGE